MNKIKKKSCRSNSKIKFVGEFYMGNVNPKKFLHLHIFNGKPNFLKERPQKVDEIHVYKRGESENFFQ